MYYREIIKVHTVLASHTVAYPGVDLEQFDFFCRKMFYSADISFLIFVQSNKEQPLLRCHLLKAIIILARNMWIELESEDKLK